MEGIGGLQSWEHIEGRSPGRGVLGTDRRSLDRGVLKRDRSLGQGFFGRDTSTPSWGTLKGYEESWPWNTQKG